MAVSTIKRIQGSNYRLRVRNLGPITEADIDFRPLTVFVGPSNTGKSYLATMNYALHRYFARDSEELHYRTHWRRSWSMPLEEEPPESLREDLDSWLAEVEDEGPLPHLPDQANVRIRSLIEKAKGVAVPLRKEMTRCFGVDSLEDLIRRPRAQAAEVGVEVPRPDDRGSLRYRLRIRRGEFELVCKVVGRDEPFVDVMQSQNRPWLVRSLRRIAMLYSRHREESRDSRYQRVLYQLAGITHGVLADPLRRQAYYLPADRTGVMHSHKVVVSALVQSAAIAGLRPGADVPILSGVLADFLEQLVQMAGRHGRMRMKNGDVLASRVEETVLGGGVRAESSEANYPQFVYQPEGWKTQLPLMRASSMVSELAPIVLYLRHVVRRGDVLVIEEPESHLHPAMQVEVIRRLAEIVRAGIRVIVTTHSEWVLDELANIVQGSQVERSDQEHSNAVLYPDEVGAWLFHRQAASEGVVVEELKTDDEGLYPSGFDEVAVALHNRWANIVSRIRPRTDEHNRED